MRPALVAALMALAMDGCGTGTAPRPRPSTPSKVAEAQATHEYPSAPPPQGASGASATAVEAVAEFARAYINWDAQSVSADLRGLAARSVGQARSALQLAAAQTAADYELRRGGIANHGAVEAIAPLVGARDEYVVVTRELTTATATDAYQGLQPAWHVALATVVQLGRSRWVVSGWQPES